MKNQALFSSKDKGKKLKCGLLQFLFGALRINSLTTKMQTTKFLSANFQKKLSLINNILRIQQLQGKHCRSR